MPDTTDPRRLERERLEADRCYNDALTTLDRALVHSLDATGGPPSPDTTVPLLPRGWRGRWLRIVQEWLAPLFEQQHTFNVGAAQALSAAAARERKTWRALEQFETALMLFLQQITAFVDTKDRHLAAVAAARLDGQDQALEAVPDLRAQVGVLQRAVQMIKRELQSAVAASTAPASSSAAIAAAPATSVAHFSDCAYLAFEDQFRGSDEDVREKQRVYVPLFTSASDVLDIGCGRGEFLALLQAEGIRARGVDANHEMVALARERGLDVTEQDALAHLVALPDFSLGGLMAAQVVEHLEPSHLMRLLEAAHHKLRPGAPIVIETINPACWLAFFSSYIRDFTHVRPLHPETLQYLLRASGFDRVSLRYSAPVPDQMKMKPTELGADVITSPDPAARAVVETARIVNRNAAILNNLLFTYLDYAAVGYRS